jgi:hypothetical protein
MMLGPLDKVIFLNKLLINSKRDQVANLGSQGLMLKRSRKLKTNWNMRPTGEGLSVRYSLTSNG